MQTGTTMRPTRRSVTMALALLVGAVGAPFAARAAEVEGVTAAVWAVSDASTGEVLAAQGLEQPSKIASIAKVMTALVIVELAAEKPEILDEEVAFSDAAVTRAGTKTGLKAGERLSVRDALYGLLLPSGNDAGYALARHFNARLANDGQAQGGAGSGAFLAAMNRKAQALGMTQSHFRSSFGDAGGPNAKTSSPRDLLILARAAMANPLFRTIVGTRRHAAKTKDAAGAERTVTWENGNKLLGRPGITGIKTGVNKSAGSCLLTEATVDGRRYHVVVLGSRNNVERFNDTLKLLASVSGRGKRQ